MDNVHYVYMHVYSSQTEHLCAVVLYIASIVRTESKSILMYIHVYVFKRLSVLVLSTSHTLQCVTYANTEREGERGTKRLKQLTNTLQQKQSSYSRTDSITFEHVQTKCDCLQYITYNQGYCKIKYATT